MYGGYGVNMNGVTGIMGQNMDLITGLSLVLGIISVFFGGYAIWQSHRYNKAAKDLNDDTRQLLMHQIQGNDKIIRLINKLESESRRGESGSKISLKKDEIRLRKLTAYKKISKDKLMEELSKLSVKKHTLEYIKNFLEDDQSNECCVNFYSDAKYRDGTDLTRIYEVMLKYDILIDVNYMV